MIDRRSAIALVTCAGALALPKISSACMPQPPLPPLGPAREQYLRAEGRSEQRRKTIEEFWSGKNPEFWVQSFLRRIGSSDEHKFSDIVDSGFVIQDDSRIEGIALGKWLREFSTAPALWMGPSPPPTLLWTQRSRGYVWTCVERTLSTDCGPIITNNVYRFGFDIASRDPKRVIVATLHVFQA